MFISLIRVAGWGCKRSNGLAATAVRQFIEKVPMVVVGG